MSLRVIGRLEALLERVQRNAASPRSAAVDAELVPAPSAGTEVGLSATPVDALPITAQASPSTAPLEEEELLELDEVVVEEELPAAPVSAPRPVAATLDEALSEATELGIGEEYEPISHPAPPQSGPMSAPGVLGSVASPRSVEFEVTLSEPPPPPPPGRPPMPTLEQLGAVIDLEEEARADFELEMVEERSEAVVPADELELELPKSRAPDGLGQLTPAAVAHASLAEALSEAASVAPAVDELEELEPAKVAAAPAVDTLDELDELEPASEAPAPPSAPAAAAVAAPPTPPDAVGVTVVERTALEPAYVARVSPSAPAPLPATFLELLDASLALGSEE